MNGMVEQVRGEKNSSPMEKELGHLSNGLAELRGTVQTLRERLSPISSIRALVNEKDRVPTQATGSMLVNTVRGFKSQIDEIRDQIQEIMAHIEI